MVLKFKQITVVALAILAIHPIATFAAPIDNAGFIVKQIHGTPAVVFAEGSAFGMNSGSLEGHEERHLIPRRFKFLGSILGSLKKVTDPTRLTGLLGI